MQRAFIPYRALLLIIVLALTLMPAYAQDDVIRVGAVAPLSSPGSYQQGKELLLGLQWAVDDINAKGGLMGKQVKLFVEDSQGKPPEGAKAVEKLITKDKVVGIAGEYHSSVCNAEIEVFHRYGIPFVIGSCWYDGLTAKGYPEVYRTSVFNSKQAENIAGLIKANGIKKVAALVEDTDYGIGIAENIKTMMKVLEVDAEFDFEVVEKTSKDFVPILLKYKTRVKPDLLVVAVTQPGGFLLLKQAHEIHFAPSPGTMVLDGTCTAQNAEVFWSALKDAGQYIMMACPYSSSVQVTELGEAIKKRYIDQFKREPNYLPLQGYDAMFTLLSAIEAAGSTDAKAMMAELDKTKLTGTRGEITFSKEKGVWHNQWKAVPAFIFQYTAVNQSPADAAILYPPKYANAGIAKPEK
ncbi:ABC transporter substrate-binding protein [Candidatus Entotheonella palauensis]|nr:ABC transporter substrate-binding protein [Candidatus Entotheonella palauensis]